MSRFLIRLAFAYAGYLLCEAIKTKYVEVQIRFSGEEIAALRASLRRSGMTLNEYIDHTLRVRLIRAERKMRRNA